MKIHSGPAPPRGQTLFETRVPSRLENLTPLAVGITSECITRGLVEEMGRDHLELCLQEVLNNAMVHGNRMDAEKLVTVRIFQDLNGWAISVRDQGEGFTPEDVPDPEDPSFVLRDSGRGIHILSELLANLEYWDGGREAVLVPRATAVRA